MKHIWAGLLVAVSCIGSEGQVAAHSLVKEFPEFRVYPGILDEGGFPLTSSRLCTTESKPHCFALQRETDPYDKDDSTPFALRSKSQRIKLDNGGSLVLFNANSGGGSGSSDRYVLLRYDSDGRLTNLLPKVIVTNQADVAVWNLPTVSILPVILTADALWEDGGHYSPHFFEVRVYIYDPVGDKYKLRTRYRTPHRHPGIDNEEQQPEVLEKERERIIRALLSSSPPK